MHRRYYSSQKNVAVALSGGVDSSVSAYLLQQQGYNVTGVYMRNWSEEEEGHCTTTRDLENVDKICHFLKIPYKVVDFQKDYWNKVFQPSIDVFERGDTPNPDILCNREIKFKCLTDYVFGRSNSDYLATGHYSRIKVIDGKYQLLKGFDPNKDQSYFLMQLNQDILKRVLFPVGEMLKPQVREIAEQADLPNAKNKESMGICFIGKRRFDEFLGEYIPKNPGPFIDIDSREVIGEHDGLSFYTVGQSARLSGMSQRAFVVKKDLDKNVIYTCFGSDHPALYSNAIQLEYMHWIQGSPPVELFDNEGALHCSVKVRYRTNEQNCKLKQSKDGHWIIEFETPQKACAPGQYSGLYLNDICLGGGPILKSI